MFLRILALLGVLVAIATPAAAQAPSPSAGDRSAIRDVIQGQIDAFGRDDADAAFAYASPAIRSLFGRSSLFMEMVRQGYPPVYRPQMFEFGAVVSLNGQLTQKVHVVGPDGRPVTAFYPMTRLPDGSWRIDGCYLQAPEEHQS